MASKPLIEYLARYNPEGIQRDILASAGEYKCRVNKEAKMLEITADFPRIYRKSDIRLLESEIKAAYQLNYVHVITHYGKELFQKTYMDEMLQELQMRGAIAKGFFYDYDYSVDEENQIVEIRIGFSNGGIELCTPMILTLPPQRYLKTNLI